MESGSEDGQDSVGPSNGGSSEHDIGADKPPKKRTSKKKLRKALTAAIHENTMLREKLFQMQSQQIGSELAIAPSSTLRDVNPTTNPGNESMLMTTMNNMTISSLNVPECKPSEGETEIDKAAFEHWKEVLMSALDLIAATDERSKMAIFKIKAGPKLLEIFNSTVTTEDMPDEYETPFTNAIFRVDEYFGSRAYTLTQRSKLLTMSQRTNEASIQFIRRVGAAAKLCNYRSDEENEAIMRTVTKGAVDARVRTLAHRNWFSQRSLKELIDSVRDWEVEQSNENDFRRSHGQRVASAAAVSVESNDRFGQQSVPKIVNAVNWNSGDRRAEGSWYNGERRSNSRGGLGGGSRGRGASRPFNQSSPAQSRCWRCGSIFHTENDCRAKHKACNSCGKLGHISRVCRDPKPGFDKQTRAQKRNWSNAVNDASVTAAKVQKLDEVRDSEQQVMHTSNTP